MPFMAKQGNNYEEVETLVDTEGREIDYVLSKVGNTYKRTFTKVRELEDAPPLNFKSIKPQANLLDYRIYGQTENGESVGDRTGNLFDGELAQGYYNDTAGSSNDLISSNLRVAGTSFIPVSAGSTMALTYESTIGITKYLIYYYNNNKELINVVGWYINGSTFTIPNNISFIRIVWGAKEDWVGGSYVTLLVTNISNIMLNTGSTPLPYEPYGYKVPVTVEGKNLFNFDEPNVKGYDFEKQSEGVYYIADTGSLYGANRYKLDTETGKQYVLKGVIDNTNISAQLSGFLEGTENPVEGQIFKTGNINIIFTANGKTTLTIFGSKSNQSATVTNLQVYDISITDDTYEPYRTPVTTPIYLPEQIRKVGSEAEYIDYGEQKQHRVRKNLFDIGASVSDYYHGVECSLSITNNDLSMIVMGTGRTYIYRLDEITITGECTVSYSASVEYSRLYLRIRSADDTKWLTNSDVEISNMQYNSVYNGWYTTPGNTKNATITITIPQCKYFNLGVGFESLPNIVGTTQTISNIQLEKGSTATPYEPYITNTELDVTLPALPTVTGTNVLSVGTEVQPSDMYIKGNIKGGGAA